jgi:two-component system sensor histidine kinase YesM
VLSLFKNISIRYKLLLSFIIVILTCMGLFSIIIYINFGTTLQNENRQNADHVLELARKSTLNNMDYIENTLFSIQANRDIINVLASEESQNPYEEINFIEQKLFSTDLLHSNISSIHIYASNRNNYPKSYSSSVSSSKMVENELWYKNAINSTDNIYWSVFDSQNNTGTICAAKALIDTRTHKIVGVVRADVNLTTFTKDISKTGVAETGKIFIVYNNHIINLWDNDYINSFINEPAFFDALESGMQEYIVINGKKHYVNSRTLKNDNIKLVCTVKYSEINNSSKIIAPAIIITAIVSLSIAFILVLIFSHIITVPITRLKKYMGNFGNKREKLPKIYESNDEVGLLCTSYNDMITTIDNLISDVNLLSEKQKIFELKALQAQINPHFLYNTLDSINWMAKKYKAADVSKMVTALGTFFRHSLNKGQEYTSIKNEIKQVISYTEIQKVRYDNSFDIYFSIGEDLLNYQIIKLTIQPLVENSILHGFDEIDYHGTICISGDMDNDYIYITVTDNGRGCDTDKLNVDINKEFNPDESIEKYGLNNVNQRIKLYFGQDCGLKFSTNPEGGTTAVIKIRRKLG